MSAAGAPGDLTDPNIIIKRYQMMQGECQQFAAKVRKDGLSDSACWCGASLD